MVVLPNGYVPTPQEQYMNQFQVEYFYQKLITKRDSLQEEWELINSEIHTSADLNKETIDKVGNDIILFSKIKRLEFLQKSLFTIDSSLNDIINKKYGFCKKTGNPIGIERLLANPEAQLCIEAQQILDKNNAK